MQKHKILIADDHAMVRDGVKNLVQQNKDLIVIGEARSGNETLELFDKLQPDLLIMDISMPDMNGMEVSRTILAKNPGASIVILSMYDDEDYISRCLEYGVKGYVVKNESGSELEYAIRSVLQGKNYFSRQAQDVIFKKYSQNVARKKTQEEEISLTKREIEIVRLIADGLTSQQMADRLFISPRTVETHRANLMKKMSVKNAIELVKKAQQLDLLQ
ncbi:response regulator transcription factor [Fulvivirgaceae bacterium PWU4]|uniref:Response regulator transcription factor n=1 Tax=Chryseosolibacter histidini TaxID=2782349 RepID=A0AAP2GRJ7_9BACT|nr:response regulator transcription factor [Chryseosolibacter histidini]MBT1701243.1 response regulator transcription factor [Chryseosolibacter histidini]